MAEVLSTRAPAEFGNRQDAAWNPKAGSRPPDQRRAVDSVAPAMASDASATTAPEIKERWADSARDARRNQVLQGLAIIGGSLAGGCLVGRAIDIGSGPRLTPWTTVAGAGVASGCAARMSRMVRADGSGTRSGSPASKPASWRGGCWAPPGLGSARTVIAAGRRRRVRRDHASAATLASPDVEAQPARPLVRRRHRETSSHLRLSDARCSRPSSGRSRRCLRRSTQRLPASLRTTRWR